MPDLVQKVLKGQDPLHILGQGNQVRHYTYGGDLARGIRLCMEHPAALNEDFNISTPAATSVRELAQLIWKRIRGERAVANGFRSGLSARRAVSLARRIKAANVLGFQATTTLDQMLDEVIPWIEQAVRRWPDIVPITELFAAAESSGRRKRLWIFEDDLSTKKKGETTMPRGDGTGPRRKGRGTGRGMGLCGGRGKGNGRGQGGGQGRGQGRGRGPGKGQGLGWGKKSINSEDSFLLTRRTFSQK